MPKSIASLHLTHLSNLLVKSSHGHFTKDLFTCLHSVLMTIPGIGTVNGGMILGEIGDIHRFSTPGKLLAFAGLDPTVYQSGNFQAKRTRMSKRGSRVLRSALMNAAHNVVKNNATFKAHYDVTPPRQGHRPAKPGDVYHSFSKQ